MHDILFLEDDRLLAQSIIDELHDAGYGVDWVQEGDEAADAAFEHRYRLYLFDVNVPGINGFELLRQLRTSGDRTPTLFLTSRKQIEDLAEGFACGADDYVKKPFDLEELLIRIDSKMPPNRAEYYAPGFALDATALTVTCRDQSHRLPAKEFALLSLLCAHRDLVVTQETMTFELSSEKPVSVATLRTYVKNLKRRLGSCVVIENLKGVGYRLSIL